MYRKYVQIKFNRIISLTIASPEFPLVFLPFLCLYWLFRGSPKAQNFLLLFLSYGVYSLLSVDYSLILAIFTLIIWLFTFVASRQRKGRLRELICALGVGLCVLTLVFFKYMGMFSSQSQNILQVLGITYELPVVDVLLPLGLSFYTFQAIAYIVSVMRQERDGASLFDLANYLSFAPTILAGPICRPAQLLDPFSKPRFFSIDDVDKIILLVASFFVKKVWLASWIGQSYVDPVFADASSRNSLELVLALVAYSLQIFFDFSGYTDLARAIGLMLGFDLPENFNLPYLAQSLSEFWSRWHISLSTWIRDYIYFPLGGSRKGFATTLLNLMVAMSLSGLWHGASLKFLVWGIYHGFLLCVEKVFDRYGIRINNLALTFSLVAMGWIFFRCEDLSASIDYLKGFLNWNYPFDLSLNHFAILFVAICTFACWRSAGRLLPGLKILMQRTPFILKAPLITAFISLVLSFSPEGMPSFIYAQF